MWPTADQPACSFPREARASYHVSTQAPHSSLAMSSSADRDKRCPLFELVQFHCQLQHNRILCQPVERVFRQCPRQPAVEITALAEYDEHSEPYLPARMA